jgi:predicted DNA-binding protein (MmcQ/YjbR family)
MPSPAESSAVISELREFGLTFPGAHLKSPWPEHLDLAVKEKTFAFMSAPGQPFTLSLKLPFTAPEALEEPGAAPTGYGLGRSGWVSFSQAVPIEKLKLWLDESYRAVAPKTLIKQLP